MNIYNISQELKLVNQIGATLSIDERLKLELALLKLNESEQFDQILLWGKVEGTSKDYYIAAGLNFKGKYEFPVKKFFWTSNDFNFAQLPDFNPEYKDRVDSFRGLFTGQHEKILIQVTDGENLEGGEQQAEGGDNQDQQQKQDVDSDEEDQIKIPPKNFTELDRLSYVVRAIDQDCQLVPVGAFKLTPTHELRYNDAFSGLSIEQANNIQNFQHFRNPQTQDKKDLIARDDALFRFDFMDSLTQDLPTGCWSLQSDPSKTNVTIRSLLWLGYVGYHRANSNVFGGVYFGNGIKNVDLPFLI